MMKRQQTTILAGLGRRLAAVGRRGWREEAGAVQMEYVILAVLIAAAGVVAVVVFGRAVVSGLLTAGKGASLEHTQAHDELEMRRADRASDMDKARQYHDSMHE
ncbi:MAG: hypothetical protein WC789_01950 [Lentisphaeria bacterium]|jgi:Flp pilus assembly pilin Flp